MKFRKKPVVIDAVQWFPGKPMEGVKERCELGPIEWQAKSDVSSTAGAMVERKRTVGIIQTLEGEMTASPGDWIVTGIMGEKYPVKGSIFRQTYEPADGPSELDQAREIIGKLCLAGGCLIREQTGCTEVDMRLAMKAAADWLARQDAQDAPQ